MLVYLVRRREGIHVCGRKSYTLHISTLMQILDILVLVDMLSVSVLPPSIFFVCYDATLLILYSRFYDCAASAWFSTLYKKSVQCVLCGSDCVGEKTRPAPAVLLMTGTNPVLY